MKRLFHLVVLTLVGGRFGDWAFKDVPVMRFQLACVVGLVLLNAGLDRWGALLGVLPVLIPLFLLLVKPPRSEVIKEEIRALTSAIDHNTAIHEAGHAIVAFYSKATIDRVHMIEGLREGAAGAVEYGLCSTAEGRYSRVAIAFGGIAAEATVQGKWDARGAKGDLQSAWDDVQALWVQIMASKLFLQGSPNPYAPPEDWTGLAEVEVAFNFRDVYHIPPPPEQRALLELCYRRAKWLIREHRTEFDRLVVALLLRRSLTGAEVRTLIEQTRAKMPQTK